MQHDSFFFISFMYVSFTSFLSCFFLQLHAIFCHENLRLYHRLNYIANKIILRHLSKQNKQ